MKKLFTALMLVVLVSSFSFAQINKGWDGTKPEVYQGSKSFVFVYSPFVSANLGSVYAGSHSSYQDTANTSVNDMYGIGFQYYVSPQIALAIGFSFGSRSWEPTWAGQTAKSSGTEFGVSLDGNMHFKSLYSVSPYIGLNVNFGTGSATYENTVGSTTSKWETSGNSLGFGLNLGFDWYFTPGISLGGKYTLGMKMNSQPEGTYSSGATTTTYKGPKTSGFGTGIASIMLNVHL
jgi:hypothetical protein